MLEVELNQSGVSWVDQLLQQILQSNTCELHAHSKCKISDLGKTKIQEPKI